jgi:SH3 domain protein
LAVFLWFCVAALPAGAETLYVTDRFEIGVHESTDIDSVIIAVIPSGTPLTVITRTGEFVQVSTPDGTRGWVDTRYVTGEKPGSTSLSDYDQKLQDAVRSLGAARAEVEVLRQRITELQRDAATAADASPSSPDIAKPVSITVGQDSAALDDAKRELEVLTHENQQLKKRISDLKAAKVVLETSAAETNTMEIENPQENIWRGPVIDEAQSWAPWQWLLFGSILLLAFAAGGYAVDWESRRRHGGFRI